MEKIAIGWLRSLVGAGLQTAKPIAANTAKAVVRAPVTAAKTVVQDAKAFPGAVAGMASAVRRPVQTAAQAAGNLRQFASNPMPAIKAVAGKPPDAPYGWKDALKSVWNPNLPRIQKPLFYGTTLGAGGAAAHHYYDQFQRARSGEIAADTVADMLSNTRMNVADAAFNGLKRLPKSIVPDPGVAYAKTWRAFNPAIAHLANATGGTTKALLGPQRQSLLASRSGLDKAIVDASLQEGVSSAKGGIRNLGDNLLHNPASPSAYRGPKAYLLEKILRTLSGKAMTSTPAPAPGEAFLGRMGQYPRDVLRNSAQNFDASGRSEFTPDQRAAYARTLQPWLTGGHAAMTLAGDAGGSVALREALKQLRQPSNRHYETVEDGPGLRLRALSR